MPSTTISLLSGLHYIAHLKRAVLLSKGKSPKRFKSLLLFLVSSVGIPENLAELTPGCPSKKSTSRPESSARLTNPVFSDTVRAFNNAFSAKVLPSSTISPISGKSLRENISTSKEVNNFQTPLISLSL